MSTIISPSLLSANFLDLRKDIEMLNSSCCEMVHLDVMDGVFVPNISFGFPILEAVSTMCTKKLDVHFMIIHPEQYILRTAQSGVYMMTVHVETCTRLLTTISDIHRAGMKAGVSINPATPISQIEDVLPYVDMVLVMGVNPGFGGQPFMTSTYEKVNQLRKIIDDNHYNAFIEVDGGVNATTAPQLVEAGAHALVSGNYVFKSDDPKAKIAELASL